MKIKNLIAVAALLLGSTSAFAVVGDTKSAGGFKLYEAVAATTSAPAQYLISDFADDYSVPTDGTVTIPSSIPNSEGGNFVVIGVKDNAFVTFGGTSGELRLKVKKVVIDAKIKSIGAKAFWNFGNLASVEFGTSEAESDLECIGNAAFAKDPMLKAISFANCPKMVRFTVSGAAYVATTNEYTTPFVEGSGTTADPYVNNETLATITLNTGTLDFGLALANVVNLATVNIKDTKIRTLNGNALKGNTKITALELPAKPIYDSETGKLDHTEAVTLATNALAGTAIQSLTINGNVAASGVNALGAPSVTVTSGSTTTTTPTLTTVIFKGDIAANGIQAGAFLGNTKLATVTFEGVVASGAVLANSFADAGSGNAANPTTGIKMTVTALKAAAGASFNQQAFVPTSVTTAPTTKEVYLALPTTITTDPNIWNCKWEAAAAAPSKIYVECKEGDESYYYAKFQIPTTGAKTAISRGKGDVVVYSAYADGATIYMDPLYSADDKYVVDVNQAVIVKVKGTSSLIKTDDDGKKYIECSGAGAAAVTMRYYANTTTTYAVFNQIKYNSHITNQAINAEAAAVGTDYVAYAVAKISTNGLKWKAISNEGTFYVNDAFYIIAKKSAAGVRVVWLDEEATAIKNVKAAAADSDAIYNLRGEKVNAAYKGIVIKNGKKYIQK